MFKINEVLIRRKKKIALFARGSANFSAPKSSIASLLKNLEVYGYGLDNSVIEVLNNYSDDMLKDFFKDMVISLNKITGNREYLMMYPNFPSQVMEASNAELYLNAILHYCSNGKIFPTRTDSEFKLISDIGKLKYISIASDDEVFEIFKNIVNSNTSISKQDIEDLVVLIRYIGGACKRYIEQATIPNKENLARIMYIYINEFGYDNINLISSHFKTATDVLRFITAISDGDTSLSTNTRFKNMNRPMRRFIMNLLANIQYDSLLEDMFRYKNKWIRIGEIIHPRSFKSKKYIKVLLAFNHIRNSKKPLFFNGAFNYYMELIKDDNYDIMDEMISHLKQRPGEFARRLDYILRNIPEYEHNRIIKEFSKVANKISIPVLLQVYNHFTNKIYDESSNRVFFPKGNVSKVYVKDETPSHIPASSCIKINFICVNSMVSILSSRSSLGKVYIDNEFEKFVVPFSLRNASSASKIAVRGSRLPVDITNNILRLFTWWTNTEDERVDIDLSAGMFNENLEMINHISYHNLREEHLKCYHSGDIVDGGSIKGKGVSEFIDFDLSTIPGYCRYVVFSLHNYTGQSFNKLPNCCFGWMQRSDLNDGNVFEPSTVDMLIDVNANSIVSIPAIYDCVTNEIIWCDLNINMSSIDKPNNIINSRYALSKAIEAVINFSNTKPSLAELCKFNATARGEIVDNIEDADIIFSNKIEPNYNGKTVISAFDIDYFIGNMM